MVTWQQVGIRPIVVLFLAETIEFYLLQNLPTGSEDHTISYSTDTEVSIPGCNMANLCL